MFRALIMSVGMFSILPVPKNHWEERFLPWVIPMMPVVGGLIGLLWYAIAMLTPDLPSSLRNAVVMSVPFVLSGFLHLDGFMDTSDAVFSRRNPEEKKRILKDSHVGAFAVIALAGLFLFQFCTVETILDSRKPIIAFLFIPVVSRCMVGLSMLRMKPMSETGFAVMFQKNTGHRHQAFPLAVLIVVLPLSFIMGSGAAILALLVESFFTLGTMFYLQRQFRGISGDLCGCSITLGELSGLLALALI